MFFRFLSTLHVAHQPNNYNKKNRTFSSEVSSTIWSIVNNTASRPASFQLKYYASYGRISKIAFLYRRVRRVLLEKEHSMAGTSVNWMKDGSPTPSSSPCYFTTGEQPGGPTSLVITLTLKSKRDNILLLAARYTCEGSCLSLERNVRITLLASGRCPIISIEESWMGKNEVSDYPQQYDGPNIEWQNPSARIGIWLFACKSFIAWYGMCTSST